MFKGSLVAMITPFTKNDEVDEKGIKELVEFQLYLYYFEPEDG